MTLTLFRGGLEVLVEAEPIWEISGNLADGRE